MRGAVATRLRPACIGGVRQRFSPPSRDHDREPPMHDAASAERSRRHQSFPGPYALALGPRVYSHSIVAGGFDDTSYTTRLIPRTSLMMRFEMRPSTSCGKKYQSAVMPSVLVTARKATAFSYVR